MEVSDCHEQEVGTGFLKVIKLMSEVKTLEVLSGGEISNY